MFGRIKEPERKKAILVVGGGSMKCCQGFLDRAVTYLKEAGMEVQLFEGVGAGSVCRDSYERCRGNACI